MSNQNARLSSSEIGGLWGTYLQESMAVCLLKYFLHNLEDNEIMFPLSKALKISELHVEQIAHLFAAEEIPTPIGFTESDVDLTVPPLFYDLFPLRFVYAMGRMGSINYSFNLSSVARSDVRQFFTDCLHQSIELYNESTALMLSKGIYGRSPMISYPEKPEFIQKKTFYVLGFLGNKRPLNCVELTEILLNIERNYFSVLLCLGLQQVVRDPEIKKYITKGKRISESQISLLNDLLMKEHLLGTIPVSMEVTDSTISPFSDKLIVSLFHFLNSIDVTLLGHALSLSMRADLVANYSRFLAKVIAYAASGFRILVNRRWLEQPPQAPNRRELIQS
jgi:hypothetical protein